MSEEECACECSCAIDSNNCQFSRYEWRCEWCQLNDPDTLKHKAEVSK